MISILETNGVYTDKEIVHGILDMEEESFPIFARLATSDKYWKENHTNQDRWVHLCAIHL